MNTRNAWCDQYALKLTTPRHCIQALQRRPWTKRIIYDNATPTPFLYLLAGFSSLTHLQMCNEHAFQSHEVNQITLTASLHAHCLLGITRKTFPNLRSLSLFFTKRIELSAYYELSHISMPSLEEISSNFDFCYQCPIIARHLCQYRLRTLHIERAFEGFGGELPRRHDFVPFNARNVYDVIPSTLRSLWISASDIAIDCESVINTIIKRCEKLEVLILTNCRLIDLHQLDLSGHVRLEVIS